MFTNIRHIVPSSVALTTALFAFSHQVHAAENLCSKYNEQCQQIFEESLLDSIDDISYTTQEVDAAKEVINQTIKSLTNLTLTDQGIYIPDFHCPISNDSSDTESDTSNCREWNGSAPDIGPFEHIAYADTHSEPTITDLEEGLIIDEIPETDTQEEALSTSDEGNLDSEILAPQESNTNEPPVLSLIDDSSDQNMQEDTELTNQTEPAPKTGLSGGVNTRMVNRAENKHADNAGIDISSATISKSNFTKNELSGLSSNSSSTSESGHGGGGSLAFLQVIFLLSASVTSIYLRMRKRHV